MIHYLDRTFCPNRSCERTDCPLRFDKDKYRATCKRIGFEMNVAFLAEQPECPPKEPQLSTRGLAIRNGRRRRDSQLLRELKGSSR